MSRLNDLIQELRLKEEEPVFALSILACVFPFIAVFFPLFENMEPYNFLVFSAALMEGALIGSIFGMISLICNRRIKSRKIRMLSLVPILILLIVIVGDFVFSRNVP